MSTRATALLEAQEIINAYLAAGYRKYPPPFHHEHAECLLQKGIRDREGRLKYYINVYVYAHDDGHAGAQAEAQFYTAEDTFGVTLHNGRSPEHVALFMEGLWVMAELDYDRHND